MPTVIVIDSSLSMLRVAHKPPAQGDGEQQQNFAVRLMDLAKWGVDWLLDHFERSYKLEYVAVLSFASQCDLVSPFTRDIAELRAKVTTIDNFDNTNIANGLRGLANYVHEQWPGTSVPVNVILVTDGGGVDHAAFRQMLSSSSPKEDVLPVQFSGTLDVVFVTDVNESDDDEPSSSSAGIFERLIDKSGLGGRVLVPAGRTRPAVEKCFRTLADARFRPFAGRLNVGPDMSSAVTLCPPPHAYKNARDFEVVEAAVGADINVKGFVTLADVASPPAVSRHVIIPKVGDEEDFRTANACVFLHGALKVNSLCAVVQVAEEEDNSRNWFGIVFSHSDSKKKSCLVLALFEPGDHPVPWLGNLRRLGPLDDLNQSSQEAAAFPIRLPGGAKPSYSGSPVVWIRAAGLQGDIQKVLRHARKLPDKTGHFYKELNRLKRASLTVGFHELLEAVATLFDRECAGLPGTAHPDCAMQLSHAAAELRKAGAYDVDGQIAPLTTKFHGGGAGI